MLARAEPNEQFVTGVLAECRYEYRYSSKSGSIFGMQLIFITVLNISHMKANNLTVTDKTESDRTTFISGAFQ